MDIAALRACLDRWLARRLQGEAHAWVSARGAELAGGAPDRTLFLSFSAAARRAGRAALKLDPAEREEAHAVRPGWQPDRWTVEQAARTLLVLSVPADDPERHVATLGRLFAAADVGELVALYQALPVLPHQARHVARCAEGIRTNMTSVFTAIAHRNPYPSEQLAEEAWNQMVLKALFVGVALHPIVGLDQRANPALARMLLDYAHERWAAGRPVSPELWRCVGPHADDAALEDLTRVLRDGEPAERRAAALALRAAPLPEAARLLARDGADLPLELDWSELTTR